MRYFHIINVDVMLVSFSKAVAMLLSLHWALCMQLSGPEIRFLPFL